MSILQSHPSLWRSRHAIHILVTAIACLFLGHQPSHAADDCDIYETRIVTTPAPPQWGPTYQRFDVMMARFPAKADVVLFGDSLAEGWPEESVRSIFPGKAVGNLGVGGDLIQNALWGLEQMPVSKISPKAIVMMLGTNNLKARSTPCAIKAGLTKTVEKLHEIWPQAIIYMFTIPPRGQIFNDFEPERQEVNAFIETIPSHHNYVRAVSGFDDMITCEMRGTNQLQEWFPTYFPDVCANFSKDNLHLSRSGYDVLASILKQGSN